MYLIHVLKPNKGEKVNKITAINTTSIFFLSLKLSHQWHIQQWIACKHIKALLKKTGSFLSILVKSSPLRGWLPGKLGKSKKSFLHSSPGPCAHKNQWWPGSSWHPKIKWCRLQFVTGGIRGSGWWIGLLGLHHHCKKRSLGGRLM